jgi:hypothetical protein
MIHMDKHSSIRRQSEKVERSGNKDRKWRENSILEAIRQKGYEPDEILIRGEQGS